MSLRFKGGNIVQKGRGIGGILRAVSTLFKPFFKSVGSTALKVARSDTGKAIGKVVKEQAIKSAKNIALNTVKGDNFRDSVRNEVSNVRKRVANSIENEVSEPKKRKSTSKIRRKKKISYGNRYSDGNDWLSK